MTNDPILSVQHLKKSFGNFTAVKDVSFTVNKGDIFGFLGPNGAGKSTTMRCMLSLIRPDAGHIQIFGKDLQKERAAIMSRIGSIVEKPDFYKYLSALQNLKIFARISGAEVSEKQLYEQLEFVGLAGREKDKVAGFSHGMKQRLGIAQTLLHQPELIILDEPTTGLDPQGIIEVRELILRLKHEQQKTVILSSHQLAEIELVANRMVIINRGEGIVEGEVAQLMNQQETALHIEFSANAAAAANFIQTHFSEVALKISSPKTLELNIEKQFIPALNAKLVAEGFEIMALEPKRKLEDFFIQMTQSNA
jgi:ABC-2 type transport system ATP-binding protein